MSPPEPFLLHPPTLEEILAARKRITGIALRSPIVRLGARAGEREIWLKLENLQPIGSFKIRGAGSALACRHGAASPRMTC